MFATHMATVAKDLLGSNLAMAGASREQRASASGPSGGVQHHRHALQFTSHTPQYGARRQSTMGAMSIRDDPSMYLYILETENKSVLRRIDSISNGSLSLYV